MNCVVSGQTAADVDFRSKALQAAKYDLLQTGGRERKRVNGGKAHRFYLSLLLSQVVGSM